MRSVITKANFQNLSIKKIIKNPQRAIKNPFAVNYRNVPRGTFLFRTLTGSEPSMH
jgi:hypothetical protein